MNFNETVVLDFDDDKREPYEDTEVVELSGSPLAEDPLAGSDQKQTQVGIAEDPITKGDQTQSEENVPQNPSVKSEQKLSEHRKEKETENARSLSSEIQTVLCGNVMEEGEEVDDACLDDIEEGEIRGLPDSEFLSKYSCQYYQKGACFYGANCRFFHLTDKGLYSMFDTPAVRQNMVCQISLMEADPSYFSQPTAPPQQPPSDVLSAWDKALVDLKDLIEQSKVKKKDELFEENKLYLTVENDDTPVKTFDKSSQKDKSALQAACKRMLSRFVPKQHERSKKEPDFEKKSFKADRIKKSNYHSEWTDPWRRSKTPPKRKRCLSKSSASSSRSSESASTSKSPSKCQKEIPKHLRHRYHKSGSRSLRRRPVKPDRRSSSSSNRSPSHCSKRYSPSPAIFVRTVPRNSRKRGPPSWSPSPKRSKRRKSLERGRTSPFRRRSRSISPTLPFCAGKKNSWERAVSMKRKPPPSISRSISPSQSPSQPVEKHFEHTPAQVKCSLADSRSSSSHNLATTKLETSQNLDNRSCSDMSISPISHSSAESMRCVIDDASYYPVKPNACSSSNAPLGGSASKHRNNTDIPYSSPAAPVKAQNKRLNALELQLCRYRNDLLRSPPPVTESKVLNSSHSKGTKAAKSCDSPKLCDKNTKKTPKTVKPISKREMLLKQLQCIEEAIARKKKLVYGAFNSVSKSQWS